VQGLGIWRGALFQTPEVTFGVLRCDILKDVNGPPGIPYALSRVTGSQREVGARLCVFFRIYAELYRDRTFHKYFNNI